MISFEQLLATLTQITIRARLHWDIWWAYQGEAERPKLLPVMQKYSEFVRFDEHAHISACIVALYQLYEKRHDTRNLRVLLSRAASVPKLDGVVTELAATRLEEAELLARKVRILRNNAFAHRSLALSYDDAFEKAQITPFQLRDLCETALELVNRFHGALGDGDWPFNDYPVGHLRRLLRDLRDFHGLGSVA